MATTVDGSTGVSQIQDDKVTVAKLDLISTGSVPSLEAKGTSGVTSGYLKLNCSENSHGIKLLGPPHSATADYTLTFPNNDGDAGQFLQSNGSGVMSWAAAGGGMELLSTLNTTSGNSHATGTLNLTGFKQLLMSFYSIGSSGTAGKLQMTPNGGSATILYPVSSGSSSQAQYTLVVHDLGSGIFTAPTRVGMARNITAISAEGPGGIGINKGLTASTTTITFNYDGTQTFNVGQILIYGIK